MKIMSLGTCTRHIPCSTCDDPNCIFAGELDADCPAYPCQSTVPYDCENCDFLKHYLKETYQ